MTWHAVLLTGGTGYLAVFAGGCPGDQTDRSDPTVRSEAKENPDPRQQAIRARRRCAGGRARATRFLLLGEPARGDLADRAQHRWAFGDELLKRVVADLHDDGIL